MGKPERPGAAVQIEVIAMMDRAQLATARVFEGDANRDESAGDGLDKLRTHPVVLAWLEMDVPAMAIWLGGG